MITTPAPVQKSGVLKVKLDKSAPILSVTAPTNNTNTTSATILVAGTVSDTASGISSVKVNNVDAQVSGSSFSLNIPLVIGLNTISVTASDGVGHTTTAPSLTVLRNASASSPNSTNNSSPTTLSNNPSGPNTTNNVGPNGQGGGSGNEQGQTLATEDANGIPKNNELKAQQSKSQTANPNGSVSTPVKVAVGIGTTGILGLGIASFLGYVPYKKFGLHFSKLLAKIR